MLHDRLHVHSSNSGNIVLEKAASWAAARKMNETELLNMRLSHVSIWRGKLAIDHIFVAIVTGPRT